MIDLARRHTADWLSTERSYFDTGWIEQKWSCGITHRFWRQTLHGRHPDL